MISMEDEEAPDDGMAGPTEVYYDEVADTPNPKLRRISKVDVLSMPESYQSNSPKEELALEYVEHFRRQFVDLYTERRELMLCPINECGVKKFICTTLRPSQLCYKELYDYDSCAAFVADYVTYEPLELAGSLPRHMPSPNSTLAWQAGDCFDMAQLLVSLLLGVGYDAYVVSGYAKKHITLNDECNKSIPKPKTGPAEVRSVRLVCVCVRARARVYVYVLAVRVVAVHGAAARCSCVRVAVLRVAGGRQGGQPSLREQAPDGASICAGAAGCRCLRHRQPVTPNRPTDRAIAP